MRRTFLSRWTFADQGMMTNIQVVSPGGGE